MTRTPLLWLAGLAILLADGAQGRTPCAEQPCALPGPQGADLRLAFDAAEDGWALPGLGGAGPGDLAAEALRRGQTADSGATRETWELWLVLSQILRGHPGSREAFLLRRGRLHGLDTDAIAAGAAAWRAANPGLLDGYRAAETATAAQPAEPARPAPSWFRPPAAAAAPPPSWFRIPATAAAAPPAATPPRPGAAAVPLGQRELFDLLKETTVLVIELGQVRDGRLLWLAHGTGSFISPTLVLTNTHVIERSPGVPGQAFLVVNRALGVSRAVLRARGQSASGTGVDAAVLEVLDVRSPKFLELSEDMSEGDEVVLSGFAAKANALDRAFTDLKDMVNSGVVPTSTQIPSPKFSSGRIQAVFTDVKGEETVAADVEATGGASGSALTDRCARMVALLYAVSTSQIDNRGYVDSSTYNYSASAREVARWLDSARIPHSRSRAPCGAP